MKTLTWVIVIIIIVLGLFLLLNKGGSQPVVENQSSSSEEKTVEKATSPPQESPLEISYTDQGFEPKELEIKLGQTVKFVNNSSHGMWVASAIHPTHSVYPVKSDSDCLGSSFDQCQAGGPGSSWEFTFTQKGSWGFHNHVKANDVGRIIVK